MPDAPWYSAGLHFSCTQCGRCCSGSPGFVLLTEDECIAIARRLNMPLHAFKSRYTHLMSRGRSLNDQPHLHYDCVFLDRTTIPGKAICGIYEDRPAQCRTWPFWSSNLHSEQHWTRAAKVCPGIDHGPHHTLVQITAARQAVEL